MQNNKKTRRVRSREGVRSTEGVRVRGVNSDRDGVRGGQ